MKGTRTVLPLVLAFAAGAFVTSREDGDKLRTALRQDPRVSASQAAAGEAKAKSKIPGLVRDDTIVRVLSALQGGSMLKKRHDLSEALEGVSTAELAALLDRAQSLPPRATQGLSAALLERWFELDAAGAETWVRTRHSNEFWQEWEVWGRMAPESVLAAVHSIAGSDQAERALKSALQTLAGPDKAAQAARLLALPSDVTRDKALQKILGEWSNQDPARALEFARTMPPGTARNVTTHNSLLNWLGRDPQKAADAVSAYLLEQPGSAAADRLAATAAEALARKDPQQAIAWIQSLPQASRSAQALAGVARAWATTDPIAALEWSQANGMDGAGNFGGPAGHLQGRSVVASAMSVDPAKTLQWIQSLPDQDKRAAFLESALMADSKFTRTPVTAENAQYVVGLMGGLPADSQEIIAFQLGKRGKPEDTRIWAAQFTEASARAAVIEATAETMALSGRAQDFESQFTEDYQRDAALRGIARAQWAHAQYPSPDRTERLTKAAQTALQITSPDTRFLALDQIVPGWLFLDRDNARKWLQQASQIPAEWREAWSAP